MQIFPLVLFRALMMLLRNWETYDAEMWLKVHPDKGGDVDVQEVMEGLCSWKGCVHPGMSLSLAEKPQPVSEVRKYREIRKLHKNALRRMITYLRKVFPIDTLSKYMGCWFEKYIVAIYQISHMIQAQLRYICHPRWGEVRPWLPPILLPRILSANIGKSNYYFVSFPILSMTWNLPVCAFCADNKDKQIYKIKRPLRRPAILLTWFCKTNVVEIREHVFVVIDIWFTYLETFNFEKACPPLKHCHRFIFRSASQ